MIVNHFAVQFLSENVRPKLYFFISFTINFPLIVSDPNFDFSPTDGSGQSRFGVDPTISFLLLLLVILLPFLFDLLKLVELIFFNGFLDLFFFDSFGSLSPYLASIVCISLVTISLCVALSSCILMS